MKNAIIRIVAILLLAGMLVGCQSEPIVPTSENSERASESEQASEKSSAQEAITSEEISSEAIDVSDVESEVSSNISEDVTSGDETSEIVSDIEDTSEIDNKDVIFQNTIAMQNYLAVVTEEIENSKNSRLALDEVADSIRDNLNTSSIDHLAQDYINQLLYTIEAYQMIAVKRERLQYIYNQDKAKALKSAVPNPLTFMSIAGAGNWKKMVASVVYTIADSYTNYQSYNDELDKQFLLSGWELDDAEKKELDSKKDSLFNYRVDISQESGIEGAKLLSGGDVKRFVEILAENNIDRRLQKLKADEGRFALFGRYWLECAECYYSREEYENCLLCVDRYLELYTGIFERDYLYAQFLPKAIIAAQNVYEGQEYIDSIKSFTDDIGTHTDSGDWALHYFAAQSYLDLFAKSGDASYLQLAYDTAYNIVNELSKEQIELNQNYLADVVELKLGGSQSSSHKIQEENKKQKKEEQKKLDELNKSIREKRKTECLSIYEPLEISCELLFAIAEQLKIDQKQQEETNKILRDVFLIKPIYNKYSYTNKCDYAGSNVQFEKREIVIPADLLRDGATVLVTVEAGGQKMTFDDWQITEVERPENGDISSYKAHLVSKTCKGYKWSEGAVATVRVSNGAQYETITFNFKVVEFKANFIFPDTVVFERI